MQLREQEFENVNAGEPRIRIPEEGAYPAEFVSCRIKHYGSWGEKLIFRWNVFTSLGLNHFVPLDRYYNVERDGGGRLKFGPCHAFRKDWIAANRSKHPLDRSSLPIVVFRNGRFLVDVETVRKDSKDRLLPSSLHWSKIARIVRPIDEGELLERLPVQLLIITG